MSRKAVNNVISCIEPMSGMLNTLDPFLFCAYHVDNYPAGDKQMRAPRRGNGADFNPSADYRMYHGDMIPGFPQHPHRGFETLTATVRGIIDHADSAGNAGRYGHGDLQWMTAGKGIVHGEMFPLVNGDAPNPLKLFQIWLNLPAKSKMVDPFFTMHWAENIPRFTSSDGKVKATIWAGGLEGLKGLTPPPNSYASDPRSEIGVWHIELLPGGKITIPAATGGDQINRKAYFLEGRTASVGSQSLPAKKELTLFASQPLEIENTDETSPAEFLILQGRPIGEPVAQHGPFVMNTRAEIAQAFADYQKTQFGGWPWPKDDMHFPREKGRFALLNGQETVPPSLN